MAKTFRCAVFTGEDGSMGLRNGRVYAVEIKSHISIFNSPYTLQWVDPTTNKVNWCPYSSESALHKNWKFIKSEDIQYYDAK